MQIGIYFKQKLLAEALDHYLKTNGLESHVISDDNNLKCDILLVDYTTLLSSSAVIRNSSSRIVLFDTGLSNLHKKIAFFLFGIQGIICPDTSWPLFVKALQEIHKGEIWFKRSFMEEMLNFYKTTNNIRPFSQREKEILFWICVGLKNEEIAKCLNISLSTVKITVSKLLKKLNVKNRTQLQTTLLSSALWNQMSEINFFESLKSLLCLTEI
ncbi:LuxR C-terminal-related transcriptional regulator [Thermosulfurimonas sp. F29]|uniref:response regulator transcription factor n=1 Tax=Thermosulfurimonas sp. F29 TaxID=2867247 RepID=UPI001C82A138|nr:LuxR C-terminal-related transcriptional regulator [Thermosulfurimonas sp. F29]MBX6423874.1 LuxR C-terminal-related transcriptional regulator [Thermosulfurimonas sp. F29]